MKTNKVDYKKTDKEFYLPPKKPVLITVPEMNFIMVDGKGNPNQEGGEYKQAVELLYALTYTIKMSKMGKHQPTGYFEYVVPPLEGLWWIHNEEIFNFQQKDNFCWTAMIRQPEFVTEEVFQWACEEARKKKPHLRTDKVSLKSFTEGLCVQMLHIGSYDNEPESFEQMFSFMEENNLKRVTEADRTQHHEIYISDPRRTKTENLKTVLRIPVE
ncbi:GyrI-like domain-containing protein [Bacillus sp. AGMB 02131]|uniref:GyrI-like domain-containing protein n=1 Tax=Peribacillus faecalis TaxID=2772559 RepID=A0A927CTF0_9BACI|nr:GyrI-like domain-containing protein [Peribacillus faecalis]MBD3107538.1 GyrI-like domain-containing protein [Peribacillus faecalis]